MLKNTKTTSQFFLVRNLATLLFGENYEKFVKICKSLCKENERILESLKDLEPKNDS